MKWKYYFFCFDQLFKFKRVVVRVTNKHKRRHSSIPRPEVASYFENNFETHPETSRIGLSQFSCKQKFSFRKIKIWDFLYSLALLSLLIWDWGPPLALTFFFKCVQLFYNHQFCIWKSIENFVPWCILIALWCGHGKQRCSFRWSGGAAHISSSSNAAMMNDGSNMHVDEEQGLLLGAAEPAFDSPAHHQVSI